MCGMRAIHGANTVRDREAKKKKTIVRQEKEKETLSSVYDNLKYGAGRWLPSRHRRIDYCLLFVFFFWFTCYSFRFAPSPNLGEKL